MKKYLFLSAVLLALVFSSCKEEYLCECDKGQGFEEVDRYDNKKEAESGCYTTEVNLQTQNPGVNCRVVGLK